MGLRPALGTKKPQPPISSRLLRFVAGEAPPERASSRLGAPSFYGRQSGTIPIAAAFAQVMRANCGATTRATVSKVRPIGPQVPAVVEGSGVSRPKLGKHGRREIGRALEAMYQDVVKQGVPPRILQLLAGLDARAGGTRRSPTA
jgi:hypothetical protein